MLRRAARSRPPPSAPAWAASRTSRWAAPGSSAATRGTSAAQAVRYALVSARGRGAGTRWASTWSTTARTCSTSLARALVAIAVSLLLELPDAAGVRLPGRRGPAMTSERSGRWSERHRHQEPRDQKVHLKTVVPGPEERRAARSARTRTSLPASRATRVMAGIVVDHADGQRRHRRRRQHVPRFHRRHRRQRARPRAPAGRRRHPAPGGARARRIVHAARRASSSSSASRRTPRRPRSTACSSTRAARRRSRARCASPRATPRSTSSSPSGAASTARRWARSSSDGLDVQGGARPDGAGLAPRPVRRLLSLPHRVDVPVVRPRVRRRRAQAAEDGGRRRDRRVHRRAHAGHGRERHPAGRLPAGRRARSPRSSTRSSSPTR